MINLAEKARKIRFNSLKAFHKSGLSAIGDALSAVDILVSLYYGDLGVRPVMNLDSSKPGWQGQDYFVLSKTNATPVLYSVLADKGFFDDSELEFYSQMNSMLKSKPNMKTPGVSVSVSGFGSGVCKAVSMAMSLRADKQKNKVFSLMDISEFQDGAVWEAFSMASFRNLSNLIVFVDDNGVQEEGTIKSIMDPGFLQTKMDSFGFQVYRVTDGHDYDEILNVVARAFNAVRKPVLIWANTCIGKGVGFIENNPYYAYAPISKAEYEELVFKFKTL